MLDQFLEAIRTRKQGLSVLLALLLSITVLLAVIGPFGTFERGEFLSRLNYWGVTVFVSTGVANVMICLGSRLVPGNLFWRETVTVVLFSVAFTPLLIIWTQYSFPSYAQDLPGPETMFGYVMAVAGVISMIRHGLPMIWSDDAAVSSARAEIPNQTVEDIDAEQGIDPVAPLLRAALPDELKGEVVRLAAGNHFVTVVTTDGSAELRMRFADAVRQMNGVSGRLVHRSHWVTEKHIAGGQRCDGKTWLVLSNGDEVPVSRTHAPGLRKDGLI